MYYNLYYRNANVVGKIDVWQKGGYKKVSKLDFESWSVMRKDHSKVDIFGLYLQSQASRRHA